MLAEGNSPAVGRELLSAEDQRIERIMLELRLATGFPVEILDEPARLAAKQLVADGLLRRDALAAGRCVLTNRGRLLADGAIQRLIG